VCNVGGEVFKPRKASFGECVEVHLSSPDEVDENRKENGTYWVSWDNWDILFRDMCICVCVC